MKLDEYKFKQLELETFTIEELVQRIQETNDEEFWKELSKKTKGTYPYVLKKYVHPYYKETMKEEIMTILKQGWVKAVNAYDREKATSEFIPFCTYLMWQSYRQFARRINEDKIGNSVRDELMSNVTVDGYDNTEKMTQGCIENIMKYEVEDYEQIETRDFIRDMLERLKEHDELQYIIIKEHCMNGITQKDLGEKYKMSQSAISRNIKKGLAFLKKEITAEQNI